MPQDNVIAQTDLKAALFNKMRALVLSLEEVREAKSEAIKSFNEKIDSLYEKLHALANQDFSQMQLNLKDQEQEDAPSEEGQTG